MARQTMARKRLEKVITLGYAIKEFLDAKEAKGLADKTIENYEKSIAKFIKYLDLDKEMDIKEIDESDFYHFINAMRADEIRTTSINHYIRDLRSFFSWCADREWCQSFKSLVESRVQEEEPKLFTDEEMDILLEKPKDDDSFTVYKTWVIVSLMYDTGLRARSVCNLKISDIDFKLGELTVRETKNKKVLPLPISDALASVLKEYLRTTNVGENEWLFPSSTTGGQMTYNALRQAFTRYCDARGVGHHNLHGLRYSFTKAAVQSNLHPFKLQNMLGHQSASMTSHYVKLYGGDLRENWDKHSPLDKKKQTTMRTAKVKRK